MHREPEDVLPFYLRSSNKVLWSMATAAANHDANCPGCTAKSANDSPLHFMARGCSTTCGGCYHGSFELRDHEGGCVCMGCSRNSLHREAHFCAHLCKGCLTSNTKACNSPTEPLACMTGLFVEGTPLTIVAEVTGWPVTLLIKTTYRSEDEACQMLKVAAECLDTAEGTAESDVGDDRVWVNDHYFSRADGVLFAKAMAERRDAVVTGTNLTLVAGKTCWGCAIDTSPDHVNIAHRKLGGCIRGHPLVVMPDEEETAFVPPKRSRREF